MLTRLVLLEKVLREATVEAMVELESTRSSFGSRLPKPFSLNMGIRSFSFSIFFNSSDVGIGPVPK